MRKFFRRLGHFMMGFIMGLTTLMLTGVMAMATLMYNVYMGMIWAVVIGCAGSGILYMLAFWSVGGYDRAETSSENEGDELDEEDDQSGAASPGVRDAGEHGDGRAISGSGEKAASKSST